MQKKIIALAVAGLVSGAAFAQTNVTIYGIVDVGFERVGSSEGGKDSKSAMTDGMQSGSRIGFKGEEALGGGNKVGFVLENGISNDTAQTGAGNAGMWSSNNRQSFLYAGGSWGTVAFGRMYTPQFNLMGAADPFAVGTAGDVGSNARGLWMITSRLDNVWAYVSPSFSGLNVTAAYTINGFGEEEATNKGADSKDTRVWAISPVYNNGPLMVGFNYHNVKVDLGDVKSKTWDLAATYNFGVVKAAFAYGTDKSEVLSVDVWKTKKWMLGATIPVGNGAVLASYSRIKEDEVINDKASKFALGYDYSLSKRTNIYAVYAKISEKNGFEGTGLFSLDASAGNEYLSGFNLGMRHKF